jgi:hypothetical protein
MSAQSLCQAPLGEDVECIYYEQNQSCCCEGLVWAPDIPVNVVTQTEGNNIHITWDEDSSATEYWLWWGEKQVITLGEENRFILTENKFTHSNLQYDKTYYYFIKARNQWGDSGRGADFEATTGANPNPPPVPTPDPPTEPDNLQSQVFLSQGDGSFSAPIYWGSKDSFSSFDRNIGDFDGDGLDDILLLYTNDSERLYTQIYLSNADGTFKLPGHEVIVDGAFGVYNDYWRNDVGVFSDDGKNSIILYYSNDRFFHSMTVIRRLDGIEGFRGFIGPFSTSFSGNYNQWEQTLGDFNGDSFDDVLIYNLNSPQLSTHVALSHKPNGGTFRYPLEHNLDIGEFFTPNTLSVGDFNNDGLEDIIILSNFPRVAYSQGDGTFKQPIWMFLMLDDIWQWKHNIGDINGDGLDDLVFYRNSGSGLEIKVFFTESYDFSGFRGYSFKPPVEWQYTDNFEGWYPDLGDFNGDGKQDIILYQNR